MVATDGATPRGGRNRLFFLVMLVMLGANLYLFRQADGKAGWDNGPVAALAATSLSADEVETGTHWADPPGFPNACKAGLQLRHHHLGSPRPRIVGGDI